MQNFPSDIDITDKIINTECYILNFEEANYNRVISIMRKNIYELILSRIDENDYFSIDDFAEINSCQNIIHLLVEQIIKELHSIGWKTKLSFGNTGLFIYSSENAPRSCW